MVLFGALGATAASGVGARSVTYGDPVGLSGRIPSQRAGERVIITARRFDASEYKSLATVRTSKGGRWRHEARPRIETAYRARWRRTVSAVIRVLVMPDVRLDVRSGILETRVVGARSFRGRNLVLERRVDGRWRPLKTLSLDSRSSARYRLKVPRGVSTLRLFLSDAESGPGYTAAYSPILTYTNG